jgi:hypothetical protein
LTVSLKTQPAALSTSAVVIAVVYSVSGCSTPSQADASRIQAQYDRQTGRLSRLQYDANGNGKTDTWAFMDGTRISRLEADENEDGRVDRWEYYNPSTQTSGKPVPERIERATRMDGRVSRRELFEQGELARIEEDTNGDGTIDKWEAYVGGTLSVLALDLRFRGTPDRKFFYKPDGTLDHIEVDPSGSGRFERMKQ